MITKLSVTLSDEQRNRLAALLDGKTTKRLATREEVTAVTLSLLDSALSVPAKTTDTTTITTRLRSAGKSDDYINSYLRGYSALDRNTTITRR